MTGKDRKGQRPDSLGRGIMVFFLTPHPRKGGLDFLLKAGDQFPVRGDEGLLGFDLSHDCALCGEGWEGDFVFFEKPVVETLDCNSRLDAIRDN